MIKGVDTQIMIQRTAEYSKDMSTMHRKDELANEFADRMNKLNAQQEARTVSHMGKTEHTLVHENQEREEKRQKQQRQEDEASNFDSAPATPKLSELPGMEEKPQDRLLDIEI